MFALIKPLSKWQKRWSWVMIVAAVLALAADAQALIRGRAGNLNRLWLERASGGRQRRTCARLQGCRR